jgi:hypothetical protein
MKQKNHTQLSRYEINCCLGLQTLHFKQVIMSLTTVCGPDTRWKPIKIVSGACQDIPDLITGASLKNLFCKKSTGWSKKISPIEIFTIVSIDILWLGADALKRSYRVCKILLNLNTSITVLKSRNTSIEQYWTVLNSIGLKIKKNLQKVVK